MRETVPTASHTLCAVQPLPGHMKVESTVRYFGIAVDDTLAIADQFKKIRLSIISSISSAIRQKRSLN